MLIGILSDTHGRPEPARAAVRLFDSLGVGHIVHCGDIGGTAVFDELVGRPCTFVWGNTDRVDSGLTAYLETTGFTLPSELPVRLELDGARLAVFHGHEPAFWRAPSRFGVDYILHGHTHHRRDERIGNVRVINPGALYRVRPKTVATLDTRADLVTFHALAEGL